jgi:hypothetical protein
MLHVSVALRSSELFVVLPEDCRSIDPVTTGRKFASRFRPRG